jgi:hypothetical protein
MPRKTRIQMVRKAERREWRERERELCELIAALRREWQLCYLMPDEALDVDARKW